MCDMSSQIPSILRENSVEKNFEARKSMNRKKIQRQLSAYLDRELNEEEKLVVERYLSGCQESAETLRIFSETAN